MTDTHDGKTTAEWKALYEAAAQGNCDYLKAVDGLYVEIGKWKAVARKLAEALERVSVKWKDHDCGNTIEECPILFAKAALTEARKAGITPAR